MIAAAHRVHRFDESSPSCKVCRRPSRAALRARWGCDEHTTAAKEVFRSTCPECAGTQDECDTCDGSGVKNWFRCPSSQTDAFSLFVAETYENLQVSGEWPDGQPWLEQSNLLYTAVSVYGAEVGEITKAQHEAARKQ